MFNIRNSWILTKKVQHMKNHNKLNAKIVNAKIQSKQQNSRLLRIHDFRLNLDITGI